jgi:hypothetical protein
VILVKPDQETETYSKIDERLHYAVLPHSLQLRHSLEPESPRTARGSDSPLWPAVRLFDLQFCCDQHDRLCGMPPRSWCLDRSTRNNGTYNTSQGYELRCLSRALDHASRNANGALRDNRYHAAAAFMNISGNIVPPVNRSTIGYCNPSVVEGSSPLPVHITVLPREPLAAADRKCPNSEAFVLI